MPYRALYAPRSGLAMPVAPQRGEDSFNHVGYWACLQSFLTFSFGWTRHDKGLLWWYEAGRPLNDPRLALINEVWERDGMLERYFEWTVALGPSSSPLDKWMIGRDTAPLALSPEWIRRLRDIGRSASDEQALARTPHGMHLELGDHIAGPARGDVDADDDSSNLLVPHPGMPFGIYYNDVGLGWYRHLVEQAAHLPEVDSNSLFPATWQVRVDVDSMGHLGTFERSDVTGLWYSGDHNTHLAGN